MRLIFFLVILFPLNNAWSQNCENHEASLVLENDSSLTLGGGTDHYYSNGFEALFRCHTDVDEEDSHTNPAYATLHWFNPNSDFVRTSKGLRFGQKIYTSSDLSQTESEIDTRRDRPYAGWIYASFLYEAETLQDRYLRHEISLGCVGPCSQADSTQTEWHEFFGFVKPEGWDLQIKNQLALQYFLEYKTNRYEVFPLISLQPRYKASLGTIFNNASFGGEFILGDKSNQVTSATNYNFKKWDWQLFLHNDIKLVAFDGTLEGSLFNNSSPHTVSPSRVVLENGVGVRLRYNRQYLFEYRFVGKSTEIEQQQWKLWDHKYGSFTFGFGF